MWKVLMFVNGLIQWTKTTLKNHYHFQLPLQSQSQLMNVIIKSPKAQDNYNYPKFVNKWKEKSDKESPNMHMTTFIF